MNWAFKKALFDAKKIRDKILLIHPWTPESALQSLEVFWIVVQDAISEDGLSPAFKAVFQSPQTFPYVKSRIRRWKKPKNVTLDMILTRMNLAVWDIYRDMMKEMNPQRKTKRHYRKRTRRKRAARSALKRRQAVKSALKTYLQSIKEVPVAYLNLRQWRT